MLRYQMNNADRTRVSQPAVIKARRCLIAFVPFWFFRFWQMAAPTEASGGSDRYALHLAVWDDDADRLQALLMTGKYGES
jgi:hypothetical protein